MGSSQSTNPVVTRRWQAHIVSQPSARFVATYSRMPARRVQAIMATRTRPRISKASLISSLAIARCFFLAYQPWKEAVRPGAAGRSAAALCPQVPLPLSWYGSGPPVHADRRCQALSGPEACCDRRHWRCWWSTRNREMMKVTIFIGASTSCTSSATCCENA